MVRSVGLVLLAYGLGSVPFSFIVARLFGVTDVRRVGSGNVGATNVLRTAGPGAGALAFLLDAAKGASSVLLVLAIGGESWVASASAVAAVLGHSYPVWLRFEGGKGVATGFGAFVPIAPVAAGSAVIAFGVAAAVSRRVSLGSIAGAVVLVLAAMVTGAAVPVVVGTAVVAILVLLRHRTNVIEIIRNARGRAGEKEGS